MFDLKTIVVPTDFSPTAEKALRFAIDLAVKTGASILHYHVYIPIEGSFAGNEDELARINKEEREIRNKRMQRMSERLLSHAASVSIRNEVGIAPLVDSIIDFSHQQGADAIVMGTQGASGLKQVLIGSTATRVIERSTVPVWLIPEKMEWEPIHQIVVAATYLPATQKWLPAMEGLARMMQSGLTIVHIVDSDLYAYDAAKEVQAFRQFEESMGSFSKMPTQFKLIESPGILQSLEKLEAHLAYDLMVMIKQKKNFWEKLLEKSATRYMACVTHKPLLILPFPLG